MKTRERGTTNKKNDSEELLMNILLALNRHADVNYIRTYILLNLSSRHDGFTTDETKHVITNTHG